MEESKRQVIAYLKPQCGWSRGVRAVLAKYGLDYEDKDIINYPENYEEMVRKTGQPLQPCVEIDGQILVDVSGEELEAHLINEGFKPSGPDPDVATDSACEDHGPSSQPIFFGANS